MFENTNSGHEAKASVRKLKPRDVSIIATNPSIQLDHFDQIRKLTIKEKKLCKTNLTNIVPTQSKVNSESLDLSCSLLKNTNANTDIKSISLIENKLSSDKFEAAEVDKISQISTTFNDQEIRDIITTSLADPRFQDPEVQESIVDDYDQHNEDIEHDETTNNKEPAVIKGSKVKKVVKKR